jgi:hypothetical protein
VNFHRSQVPGKPLLDASARTYSLVRWRLDCIDEQHAFHARGLSIIF